MNNAYSFSLLVPCFNAEPYIENFISNVNSLRVPFDEIIFYDDGSSDNSAEILEKRGFEIVRGKKNQGPGYARNRLAELTKCDFIHFHDIDDEFNPDFLLLVKNELQRNPADVVVGFADWIDAVTRKPLIQWRYDRKQLAHNPLSYLMSNPLGVINTVFSKKVFDSIGGFDERINCWEDTDLHIRMAASSARFSLVEVILAYSVRHNNGISQDQIWCWRCRLRFLKEYLENYLNIVDVEIFRAELEKVQRMFIISQQYNFLADVFALNNKYHLGLDSSKTTLIYWGDKILPRVVLKNMVKWIRALSRL